MDTQNTPSSLRGRILCRRPAILPLSSPRVLRNNWFPGCCGGVIRSGLPVSAPSSFCKHGAGGLWEEGGIISDSCQSSALFGIMFLLGVILRLQKSCCLYSEKRMGGGGWLEVGGWLCPNRFVRRSDYFAATCAQKITELGTATTMLRLTKLNNRTLYGDKTAFWH